MALFELPKYKEKEFTLNSDLKTVIDSGKLDESQVKKFAHFPELLAEELANEERCPDISSLDEDLFSALYDNNYVKFFACIARVGFRRDLLDRVRGWLLRKERFTKRDLALFKRVEHAKSVFNVFDY